MLPKRQWRRERYRFPSTHLRANGQSVVWRLRDADRIQLDAAIGGLARASDAITGHWQEKNSKKLKFSSESSSEDQALEETNAVD